MAAQKVKMECNVCGYKCFPQWLNGRAHCLKCDAVLLTQPSCHDRPSSRASSSHGRRFSGGAVACKPPPSSAMVKPPPSSAMESCSGVCDVSPDGLHHWKFGKCNFCQRPEGKLVNGPGAVAYPDGSGGCLKGGKCMFKFAKCTKCGCAEGALASPRPASRGQSRTPSPSPGPPISARRSLEGVAAERARRPSITAPRGRPRPSFGATLSEPSRPSGSGLVTAQVQPSLPGPIECHVCGYLCTPDWLNDEMRCLKCDTILKTRLPVRRLSRKLPPSSAMESESGCCEHSPNGMHHWKFGKCSHCQKCEGDFAHEASRSVCKPPSDLQMEVERCCRKNSDAKQFVSPISLIAPSPQVDTCELECVSAQESVPVGGGFRAVRKLMSSRSNDGSDSGAESTAASDREDDELKPAYSRHVKIYGGPCVSNFEHVSLSY